MLIKQLRSTNEPDSGTSSKANSLQQTNSIKSETRTKGDNTVNSTLTLTTNPQDSKQIHTYEKIDFGSSSVITYDNESLLLSSKYDMSISESKGCLNLGSYGIGLDQNKPFEQDGLGPTSMSPERVTSKNPQKKSAFNKQQFVFVKKRPEAMTSSSDQKIALDGKQEVEKEFSNLNLRKRFDADCFEDESVTKNQNLNGNRESIIKTLNFSVLKKNEERENLLEKEVNEDNYNEDKRYAVNDETHTYTHSNKKVYKYLLEVIELTKGENNDNSDNETFIKLLDKIKGRLLKGPETTLETQQENQITTFPTFAANEIEVTHHSNDLNDNNRQETKQSFNDFCGGKEKTINTKTIKVNSPEVDFSRKAIDLQFSPKKPNKKQNLTQKNLYSVSRNFLNEPLTSYPPEQEQEKINENLMMITKVIEAIKKITCKSPNKQENVGKRKLTNSSNSNVIYNILESKEITMVHGKGNRKGSTTPLKNNTSTGYSQRKLAEKEVKETARKSADSKSNKVLIKENNNSAYEAGIVELFDELEYLIKEMSIKEDEYIKENNRLKQLIINSNEEIRALKYQLNLFVKSTINKSFTPYRSKEKDHSLKSNLSFERSAMSNIKQPSMFLNVIDQSLEEEDDNSPTKSTEKPIIYNVSPINHEQALQTEILNDSEFGEELKINKFKSFILFLKDFGLNIYEFYNISDKALLLNEKELVDDCCSCTENSLAFISYKNNLDDSLTSLYKNLIGSGKHHCEKGKWNYKIIYQNEHLLNLIEILVRKINYEISNRLKLEEKTLAIFSNNFKNVDNLEKKIKTLENKNTAMSSSGADWSSTIISNKQLSSKGIATAYDIIKEKLKNTPSK